MAVSEGPIIIGISLAAVFGSAPFGVPVETIALGTGLAVLGVMGRAAFELQKVAQGQDGMLLGAILRWVGAGFLGAPFTAVLVIAIMKGMGWQVDNRAVFGFIGLGFFGPQGLIWLISFGTDFLRKRYGSAPSLPGDKR